MTYSASDLLNGDEDLNGLDELSADELAAKAARITPSRLASNPVKFAPFTAATSTTIGAGATMDFTINPSRNMIVQQLIVESATTASSVGLHINRIEFGDERQTIAAGNIPGGLFAHDATSKLRLGVLPKGIVSTVSVANVTAAGIDDVAVCAVGWTSK